MPDCSSESFEFIDKLDAAVEAHMGWTRRVLRCAVLHEAPGEDVLAPMAHTLCGFGRWLASSKAQFQNLDAPATKRLDAVHQAMHGAIRSICVDALAGRPGKVADLDAFEQTQNGLITLLAEFKTQYLANAARRDPLTGLPLRYRLEVEFLQVRKNCSRNGTRLYAGIIDADDFKRINDGYGHLAGDAALRHLATTLKGAIRLNEPLFRFGGDEFLLLMQCHTHEAATIAAKRIVDAVRNSPVPVAHGAPLPLTVTLGLAWVADEETMASAIERADGALYAGKQAGRDRYCIADELVKA